MLLLQTLQRQPGWTVDPGNPQNEQGHREGFCHPLKLHFGIDPLHLGIIFLVNLELGYLTPPVGMNLFLASYRFKRPLPEVYRAALPFLAIRVGAVLLVTYVPALTTWLPALLLD